MKESRKTVKMFMCFILTAMLSLSIAKAQGQGFGLGVILGEPSGLSGKLWIGEETAIDGALAWSFGSNSNLLLHADYLFHNFDLFDVQEGELPLYYGLGGRIKLADEINASVRIPVGIDYIFANAPLDIFFEVVLMLDLVPSTEFNLNGGIGVRYFFK